MTAEETLKEKFRDEIRNLVRQKLNEVNHYVAGYDSPFTWSQIANVQAQLDGIEKELGIK